MVNQSEKDVKYTIALNKRYFWFGHAKKKKKKVIK